MTPPSDGPDRKADVLDHIKRASPPWQRDHYTICGRPVADVASVVSFEAIQAKITRDGKRRAAFSTCMTCAERAHRGGETWERAPAVVVHTYVEKAGWAGMYGPLRDEDGRAARIINELRALALVFDRHRDEFDAALVDLEGTSSLDERRRRRA